MSLFWLTCCHLIYTIFLTFFLFFIRLPQVSTETMTSITVCCRRSGRAEKSKDWCSILRIGYVCAVCLALLCRRSLFLFFFFFLHSTIHGNFKPKSHLIIIGIRQCFQCFFLFNFPSKAPSIIIIH